MGTVAEGTANVAGRTVPVRADFASDHVVLRGGLKGEHRYADISVLQSSGGILRIQVAGRIAEFALEEKAEAIAARIRDPPTVLDKLGLAAGLRMQCIGLPADLQRELEGLDLKQARTRLDLVLLGIQSEEGLQRVPDLKRRLAPAGALWVVFPKGRRDPAEAQVIAAGRAAGLKDVKVARVSATHTALKFVVPRAAREADARPGAR